MSASNLIETVTLTIYHVAKLDVSEIGKNYEYEVYEEAGYSATDILSFKDSLAVDKLLSTSKEPFKWVKTGFHGVLPSVVIICREITIQAGQPFFLPEKLTFDPMEFYHDVDGSVFVVYLKKHAKSLEEADEMRSYHKRRKELFDPRILTLGQPAESVTTLYPTDEMIQAKLAETLIRERDEGMKKEEKKLERKRKEKELERKRKENEVTELKAILAELEMKLKAEMSD